MAFVTARVSRSPATVLMTVKALPGAVLEAVYLSAPVLYINRVLTEFGIILSSCIIVVFLVVIVVELLVDGVPVVEEEAGEFSPGVDILDIMSKDTQL